MHSLYSAVARRVLAQSLSVKKGEALTVETWETGLRFAEQVVVEARKIGAVPLTLFEGEDAYINGIREGDRDSIGVIGKHERALLGSTDAYVFIPGPPIGALSRKLDRKDVTASTRYNSAWYEDASKARLRGARLTFGYVDEDVAGALGRTPRTIVAHQLRAALTDFKVLGSKAKQIGSYLEDGARVELMTPGARLSFRLMGELETNDGVVDQDDLDSGNNMTYVPPGNVTKEIDSDSASGALNVSQLATFAGRVEDGLFEFENGRLSRWSSTRSAKVLDKLMRESTETSRVAVGLFVGLNPELSWGYGVNNLVGGVVGVRCAGVNMSLKGATLTINGKSIVSRGTLLA